MGLLKVVAQLGKEAVVKAGTSKLGVKISKIDPTDFLTQDTIHDIALAIKGVLF